MYVCLARRPQNVEGCLTVWRLEDSEPSFLDHLSKSGSHIEIVIDNQHGTIQSASKSTHGTRCVHYLEMTASESRKNVPLNGAGCFV